MKKKQGRNKTGKWKGKMKVNGLKSNKVGHIWWKNRIIELSIRHAGGQMIQDMKVNGNVNSDTVMVYTGTKIKQSIGANGYVIWNMEAVN